MNKKTTILLHAAIWAMLLLSPLTFVHRDPTFTVVKYLLVCLSPLSLMAAFYANYFWLVPKYFFGRERRTFWLVNLAMVLVLGVSIHFWLAFVHNLYEPNTEHVRWSFLHDIIFIMRDCFNVAVTAAVATAICLATRIHHNEEARLQAEAAQVDAELRNLRSQINPHFLLNTLNNIYALTAIDTARAQDAIQQLSKMLRHMLYDNQEQLVNLSDEVLFLENYINLMKIRLASNVEVTVDVDIPKEPVKVAPLIAVSLVENAFKHGVSPTEPSFVHIRIEADTTHVIADIRNSNYPKTQTDRSGHGIGLQQVQRRLDLSYPGRYTWEKGVSDDGKIYSSIINIKL